MNCSNLWPFVRPFKRYRQTQIRGTILWSWQTVGDICTTKSAYQIQFKESFFRLNFSPIWKSRTTLQVLDMDANALKKILIANYLQKWRCCLCMTNLEISKHLCKDYPFTRVVWTLLSFPGSILGISRTLTWQALSTKCDRNQGIQSRRSEEILTPLWFTSGGTFGRSAFGEPFKMHLYNHCSSLFWLRWTSTAF